jgi:hypothetical protein
LSEEKVKARSKKKKEKLQQEIHRKLNWPDPCLVWRESRGQFKEEERIASVRNQQEAQTIQSIACLKRKPRPVQRRRKKSFSKKSTGSWTDQTLALSEEKAETPAPQPKSKIASKKIIQRKSAIHPKREPEEGLQPMLPFTVLKSAKIKDIRNCHQRATLWYFRRNMYHQH